MSWGEIKTALNSTLGTSAFKPLDVIMADALKDLKELVDKEWAQIQTTVSIPAYSSTAPIRSSSVRIDQISKIEFAVAFNMATSSVGAGLKLVYGTYPANEANRGLEISVSNNNYLTITTSEQAVQMNPVIIVYGKTN